MKCHSCATFATTPQSLRRIEKVSTKTIIHHRYCRHTHEEVTSTTDACKDLTPTTYFWCKKWRGWLHIIACLANRKKKCHWCVYCKQYREIEYVCVGRDMFALFDVERRVIKPIKRNKTVGKPLLKRRKMK